MFHIRVYMQIIPSNLLDNDKFFHRIQDLVGVKVSTFSVGPDREQTNVLDNVWAHI